MPNPPAPLTPPASVGSPVRQAAEENLRRMQDAATKREAERRTTATPEELSPVEIVEGRDDAPLIPEGPPDAGDGADEASAPEVVPEEETRETAGKRVVLAADTEEGGATYGGETSKPGWAVPGWAVLADRTDDGLVTPRLYEGSRDDAIKAALDDERNAALADLVRADPARFLLVSVPASSWAPAPVKPRVTKTTWIVVR